jgi:hypothetical protein
MKLIFTGLFLNVIVYMYFILCKKQKLAFARTALGALKSIKELDLVGEQTMCTAARAASLSPYF